MEAIIGSVMKHMLVEVMPMMFNYLQISCPVTKLYILLPILSLFNEFGFIPAILQSAFALYLLMTRIKIHLIVYDMKLIFLSSDRSCFFFFFLLWYMIILQYGLLFANNS